MQLFKAKEPFIGKVVSVKRVVGPQAVGETCDIIIDHQGKMPYWEGQSYGVIPPGELYTPITIEYFVHYVELQNTYWNRLLLPPNVIQTGINAKNGKPYTNRLYSIASTRYGDDMKVKEAIRLCSIALMWGQRFLTHFLFIAASGKNHYPLCPSCHILGRRDEGWWPSEEGCLL